MNLMTLVPELTREEKIWVAYLWWSSHWPRSPCLYDQLDEDIPPHLLMLIPREVILKEAQSVCCDKDDHWELSLRSLIRKLKNELDDSVT